MNSLSRIGLACFALCVALLSPPAQASVQCPASWPPAFTAKAKQLLDLLADNSNRAKQPVLLANCVRGAAMQTDFKSAREADAENLAKVLKEVADFQQELSASLKRSGDTGAAAYWLNQEVVFRDWYLRHLTSPVDGPPVVDPLRKTYLEGVHYLMDAYEKLGKAEPAARWMDGAPDTSYYPDTLGIWVRAVASCAAWNFKDGVNATAAALKANLCSSACKGIADNARGSIHRHVNQMADKNRKLLANMHKALDACGGND